MTSRILSKAIRQIHKIPKRNHYHESQNKIGKREVVGFGYNGEPEYIDTEEYPFPAIRFKEPTPDIQALNQKEKGDWKKLSIEDKKSLYRASFRQTFSELQASTGEAKGVFGYACMGVAVAIWIYVSLKHFVYPPLPKSFSLEARQAQLERIIALEMEPITNEHLFKHIDK